MNKEHVIYKHDTIYVGVKQNETGWLEENGLNHSIMLNEPVLDRQVGVCVCVCVCVCVRAHIVDYENWQVIDEKSREPR
jgi:hypothetical protein